MKNETSGKGQGARGKVILAIVLGVLAAMPAFAQTASAERFDSRWNPWLGCWRLSQENVSRYNVPGSSGMMVCVQPSGTSGVTMTTTVEGKTVLEQKIVADGTAQPVKESDCDGLQTSDWSRDGERLFTRVELQCAGRPKQVISGITLLAKGAWVDVQAITDSDGDQDLRIRRYQRTSDQFGGASAFTATRMSVEDVIEASGKIASAALEAALDEIGGRFNLNSDVLKQLADAGVSPNVIELMVAQSFPERFSVERPAAAFLPPSVTSSGGYGGSGTSVFFGSTQYPYPYYYDPFYYNYYYYSPFAYPYYWGSGYRYNRYSPYNNYYNIYGSPTTTIVGPGGTTTGNAQPRTGSGSGTGRVVNGRGYTRVRPSSGDNEADSEAQQAPTQRTTPAGSGVRGVRSRGDSGSSSPRSSGGSVSGSGYSSGSSSSSSGSSSSSSSSSTGDSGGGGRTAQPR